MTLVSSGSTAKEPPRRAVAGRPGGAAVNCHSLAVRSSLTADPFQASCHGVLRSFSLREKLLWRVHTGRKLQYPNFTELLARGSKLEQLRFNSVVR